MKVPVMGESCPCFGITQQLNMQSITLIAFAAFQLSIARTYSTHPTKKPVGVMLGAARPRGLCSGLSLTLICRQHWH